jgi:endonuclease/exonuclease/phosphatase family metal-dependent hydrolase
MRRVLVFLLFGMLWASSIQAGELIIITINVWSGLDYKGTFKVGEYESKAIREKRYAILVRQLRDLNPDIIALQEANKLPRYASRLARDLGMEWIYSVGLGGMRMGCLGIPVNLKEGDAILAKPEWLLKRVGAVRLSGKGIISDVISFHFSESNQAIVGRIVTDQGPVYIINVHAHAGLDEDVYWSETMDSLITSGEYSASNCQEAIQTIDKDVQWRQAEIKKLLNWISRKLPTDAPVVLMGDFNASPDQLEIKWIRDKGFLDTYAEMNDSSSARFTWDPELNLNIQRYYTLSSPDTRLRLIERLREENQKRPKRIDYIFFRPGNMPVEIVESRIVLDKPVNGRHVSDHFGVMTRIRL